VVLLVGVGGDVVAEFVAEDESNFGTRDVWSSPGLVEVDGVEFSDDAGDGGYVWEMLALS
jgi:hypothetical protein